ncbi:WD40 repeat domain-containing protein [Singulisphaera sp. PoT]|uniref:WD40 repeat domain-containing protein n=1 Tax=Singulisphaera sp. PoT TaxID=3411797 RepID=UPI003BF61988
MSTIAPDETGQRTRKRRRRRLIAGVLGLLVLGGGGLGWWLSRPAPDLPARMVMDGGEGDAEVWDLAYSPDGSMLAIATARGLALRDSSDGRLIRTLPASPRFATIAFSPDGSKVAVGGAGTDDATAWDVATGRQLATFASTNQLVAMRFSPDGQTLNLVVLREMGKGVEIVLWDAAAWVERSRTELPGAGVTYQKAVALSADGATLALAPANEKNAVTLWDVGSGRPRGTLHAGPGLHWPNFTSLAFSPDGKSLASTREDGSILVLDLATSRPRARLMPHTRGVNPGGLEFTPDGRALVTVASGWPRSGMQLPSLPFGVERLLSKETVSADLKQEFMLWHVDRGMLGMASETEVMREVAGTTMRRGPAHAFAISPDGKTLATAHGDGKIRLRDIGKGR